MYIKIEKLALGGQLYTYKVFAANNHAVLRSLIADDYAILVRAAKKMARGLGIEYREVK